MSKIQLQQHLINFPNRVFLSLKNFFRLFWRIFFPEDAENKFSITLFISFLIMSTKWPFFENGQNEANCTIVYDDVHGKWDLAQQSFFYPSFLTRCPLI